MSAILNAAPKAILVGTKDESGGTLPVVPEQVPTHLPHVFLYCEKGPIEPQLVIGNSIVKTYGSKTMDLRSKYANHQTVLASMLNGNGNAMVIQRMKPNDANANATITLSIELLKENIAEYEREDDGSLKYDSQGSPIPTANTISGYQARWIVGHLDPSDTTMGQANKVAGAQTNSNGENSTIYPIMEMSVSHFGSYGNNVGMRLWAPTARSVSTPANENAIEDQLCFLYRMQFIERSDEKSLPITIPTNSGSQSVEFSFKEGTIDKKVDKELYVGQILLDSYRDLDQAPKQFGPFGDLYLYTENLEEVLSLVYDLEKEYHDSWPETTEDGMYLVNLIGGQDVAGNKYHTFDLQGQAQGGVEFTSNSDFYAAGGDDGTMSLVGFDLLVRDVCQNYSYLDTAYWPQSVVVDTGFTLDTKKALLRPMGLRKDMCAILSTQDITTPGWRVNSAEEETSMAIALRAAARLYPESEVHGTPVCRAIVVGHCGKLINSQYKDILPLTVELVGKKFADFMGSGTGVWRYDRGFDTAPYNQITMFKDVNCTYKSQSAYDKDWNAGLVWVQNFDRRSMFLPAVQTVYDDSTSVLNSAINMFVIVELEKVAERAWRQLTGTSKLTKEQFIERSNQLILNMTSKRFDDRVIIQPNTYFTDFDDILGYSWSCDVVVYMNNMMTVGTYTIISRRRSDFTA